MSKFMLNDEDAINDVNPFVVHDFSLPGGVRQTGDFEDFQEVPPYGGIPTGGKSVFCTTGLCTGEKQPCQIDKKVQPRRNIDYGLMCGKKPVVVGVSNRSIPWRWIFIFLLSIVLVLLFLRR